MNVEFEVKAIIRNGDTRHPKEIAERIMRFTSYTKENILKAIKQGGKPADIYLYLFQLTRQMK